MKQRFQICVYEYARSTQLAINVTKITSGPYKQQKFAVSVKVQTQCKRREETQPEVLTNQNMQLGGFQIKAAILCL